MIQLYTCKPFDNWEPISPLPLGGNGITLASFATDMNIAYKLSLICNTNLASHYDILKRDLDTGILLREVDDDGNIATQIGFVKDRQPQEELTSGQVKLGFLSGVYRLSIAYPRNIPNFLNYSGSAGDLVAQLAPDFNFQLISPDQNIKIDTGVLNNFELLREICKKADGWSWVDAGIDSNGLQLIKFGNFKSLTPEYKARMVDQNDPFDKNTILINGDPKVNLNGDEVTHLKVTGLSSPATGAESNSSLQFNIKEYQFLKSDYPLTDEGERDIDNNIVYYINNTYASIKQKSKRYESIELEISPNSEDANGLQVVDPEIARRNMYIEAINYLQRKSYGASLSLKLQLPRIILPGTSISVIINKKVKGWNDQYYSGVNLPDVIAYIGNVEYDLASNSTTTSANAEILSDPMNRPPKIGESAQNVRLTNLEENQALSQKTPKAVRINKPIVSEGLQNWDKADVFPDGAVYNANLDVYKNICILPSKREIGLDPVNDLRLYLAVAWYRADSGVLSAADSSFQCPVYFTMLNADQNDYFRDPSVDIKIPVLSFRIGTLNFNDSNETFFFRNYKETLKLGDTLDERNDFNTDGNKLTSGQLEAIIRNGGIFYSGVFVDDRDLSGANKNTLSSAISKFRWKIYTSWNFDGVQATR